MISKTRSTRIGWPQVVRAVRGFVCAFALLTPVAAVQAQTYTPMRYWTFDNPSSAFKDSCNNFNMDPTYYGSPYTINNGSSSSGVGKYLTMNGSSTLIKLGDLTIDTAVTVEFLFRPGYMFNTTNFMSRLDGALTVSMGYAYINFQTKTSNYSGGTTVDDLRVDLNQIGRRSWGYYMDGNWHHIVFRYNSKTGLKEIYVDGQCPSGFNKTVSASGYFASGSSANKSLILGSNMSYVKYFGDYDEMALYAYTLHPRQIYKHYQDFVARKHYTYAASSTNPPAPASVSAGLDVNEFAPGHPSVSVSAVDQLNQFPTPRYKNGHTLMKNFNWMDPRYMGGLSISGVSTNQAVVNSVSIQTELVKNWNYYLTLSHGNSVFDTAWVGLANRNPSWKLGLITFRAQPTSDIIDQSKPSSHYLQNSSGQFINADGNVTTNKIWRPTAPTSSYSADGQEVLANLTNLFTRLNRGLDMINENGEIFPYPKEAAMSKDPAVTAAKNASGLDWTTYVAREFMENETQSYRDIFMSHSRLANCKFTEFSIDGYPPLYGYKYSEARKVNTPINGKYYPTTSFYTRWPHNWKTWSSAWHGWQWIVESRVHELALGDRLFSPFVSAGWDANEEANVRPAQWLGLLKAVGMAGAEFYYSSFFSIITPLPNPKNWIWQAAMPGYAQAVTSRYEDYLRNGELMNGDVANNYINPTAPGYSFWTGDQRELVVIRKHNSGNKYAITGTIQPNTSMVGNAENEGVAKITLDGQVIQFKIRRQGSTYIYDKTNASAPVFYQLDGWHEKSHPSRWTKDFNFEGELFDNSNSQATIKTTVPSGTAAGDFTNATSYVTWPDNTTGLQAVEYNFIPRTSSGNNVYVWVRARSRGGISTSMTIQIDNGTAKTIGCVTDTAWKWYRYDACSGTAISATGLSLQNHILRITPGNPKIEIDQVLLATSSSTTMTPAASASCGTGSATVTANGSTTFCSGGSVTLTASSGSSYLWSPGGQTTQSISVNAAGSYSVSVGAGSGCAGVSNPVTVTVISQPTPTISASGSTTFCQGGSVTLTASSGSAFLWTPGNQTTQSITVSAAGTYNVRVTNSNGCSKLSSNTTVTVNSLPSATITPSGSLNLPAGGNVTLTANSGSSYLWLPGNQTSQSINVNAAGSYTVRVTNSSGCSKTSNAAVVTVSGSGGSASISTSGHTSFCQGSSVVLTASNGTSYQWSTGATTKSITASASGNYSVTVYNGSTPSYAPPVSVIVWPLPTATVSASGATSFCVGGSVTLTAPTNTSYYWIPGGQTTKSITVSTSGTYSVRVTNSNGCTKTSSGVPVTVSSCTSCDPPYGLITSNVTSDRATFSWANPNSGQTHFQIKFTDTGSGYTYVTGKVPYTTTTTTIAVIPGRNYRWWVRSWCGTNTSTYAGYLSFSTPTVRVVNPDLTEPTPSDFTEVYLEGEEPVDPSNEIVLNADEVQLFPNPATTEASLSFYLSQDESVDVTVLDLNGKIMNRQSGTAVEGFNLRVIDLTNLPKGVYMVRINGNQINATKRLVVQ